jgi:hypothetical protein
MSEDIIKTIKEIAEIAHSGGLRGLSEADALTLIRRLTLPYFDKGVKRLGVKR